MLCRVQGLGKLTLLNALCGDAVIMTRTLLIVQCRVWKFTLFNMLCRVQVWGNIPYLMCCA